MNEKVKLINMRKLRGFSQKDMANKLCMEVSGYCRRENGETKISLNLWAKIAEALTCQIEDIYEADENQSFIFNDSPIGNFCASNNTVSITIPENLLKTSEKYIQTLEKNIAELEKNIAELEKENSELKMLIKS